MFTDNSAVICAQFSTIYIWAYAVLICRFWIHISNVFSGCQPFQLVKNHRRRTAWTHSHIIALMTRTEMVLRRQPTDTRLIAREDFINVIRREIITPYIIYILLKITWKLAIIKKMVSGGISWPVSPTEKLLLAGENIKVGPPWMKPPRYDDRSPQSSEE
jgi:hypothetical protein